MTPGERLLAAAIFTGTVLEVLARTVFWIVVGLLAIAFFFVLVAVGMTRSGRRVEYGTRPW